MSDTGTDVEKGAVLDEAHVGDIQGAFGTIGQHDTGARRSWTARLLTLLAIMGPGLIVMVGDNDAGGVSTYAQAGQNFGLTLLWTLPLLIPVLIVNQEMVVRLGAVTGVGHARLIIERFGRFWGAFSVGDLFILNFLTIATEFIGVSLALELLRRQPVHRRAGRRRRPVLMTASGQLPPLGAVHVRLRVRQLPRDPAGHLQPSPRRTLLPRPGRPRRRGRLQLDVGAAHHRHRGHHRGARGSCSSSSPTSSTSGSRPRWINYERADTVIGSLVIVFAASILIAVSAAAFAHTKASGHFTDAGGVAHGLAHYVGTAPGRSSPSSC